MRNKKALVLLFTANGISGFAQGVSLLSIPWYFAQQGISSQFNFIYAFITLSTLIWGLYAGTIVDRFGRKKVFLYTNLIEAVFILSISCYGLMYEGLPLVLIIVVFTLTIFGFHLHYPNLYAFAQEITPSDQYTRVTSYIEIVGQTTNVTAGALAAVLLEGVDFHKDISLLGATYHFDLVVEKWEIYEIFLMDGITYVISFIIISFIRYTPYKKTPVELGTFIKRLKSGFQYLKSHQLIFIFGLFSYTIFLVLLVKIHAMMPMYIRNHLEEGGHIFGVMQLLYASGALFSGLFIRRLMSRFTKTAAIISMLFAATIALFLCAFTKAVSVFFMVGLIIGFSNAGSRIFRLSYLFDHVPNYLIGRVNSVFSFINVSMRFLLILLFSHSFFSIGSNITYSYAIMGILTCISGFVLLKNYKNLTRSPRKPS